MEFSKLCLALSTLGATEKETNVIWSILAAIYHLGSAGVVQGIAHHFGIFLSLVS